MGKSEHQRNRLFLPQICCFLDSRNDLHYHQNHAIDTSSTRARKQSNIIHSQVLQSTSMSTWYIKHDLWFDLSSFQVLSLNLTLGNNWSAEYLLRQAPGNEKCDAGDAAPPYVSYFGRAPRSSTYFPCRPSRQLAMHIVAVISRCVRKRNFQQTCKPKHKPTPKHTWF